MVCRNDPRGALRYSLGEDGTLFGRTDDEWDRLVNDAAAYLTEQAGLQRLVSYSDLNSALARRGHIPFDFGFERDRTAVGWLLGDAVRRTIDDSGAMLSAIVLYTAGNDAGPGFYKFATELGLLPITATADDKMAFWAGQVKAVHERFARPARARIV